MNNDIGVRRVINRLVRQLNNGKKLISPKTDMSRVMGKPCYASVNREADQRFCFRFIASTIPLLHKSKISSL